MRFCIPKCAIFQTEHEDRHEGGAAVTVKKGIPHTSIDLPPLLSVEAAGVCRLIGNPEMCLAAVHKSPQKLE
jgi:hypothetical protein